MLCAPQQDNPLKLLVLDDPLQNMDEMTVSAIARGFGKLLRIVPAGWQIVALFHGEDDLRRVSAEAACAVYRLPWLVPMPTEKEHRVGHDDLDSTWGLETQTLEQIVRSAD